MENKTNKELNAILDELLESLYNKLDKNAPINVRLMNELAHISYLNKKISNEIVGDNLSYGICYALNSAAHELSYWFEKAVEEVNDKNNKKETKNETV